MSSWITCSECGGTGQSYTLDSDSGMEDLDKCWMCDGVGEVVDTTEEIINGHKAIRWT